MRSESGDALEKFHHQVRPALPPAGFEHSADIRVHQCGCGAAFALETGDGLRILPLIFPDQFYGSEPAEVNILRLVNSSHGAAPEFPENLVLRHSLPDHAPPPRPTLILRSCRSVAK